MYQITGRSDKVYRRLNALYRKRKREHAGGYFEGRRYIHTIHLKDIVDEVLTAGLNAMEPKNQEEGQ